MLAYVGADGAPLVLAFALAAQAGLMNDWQKRLQQVALRHLLCACACACACARCIEHLAREYAA